MSPTLSEGLESSGVPIVLDACVILNLVASRQIDPILRSLDCEFIVPELVLEREVLWVGTGNAADPDSDYEPVDLSELIDGGIVSVSPLLEGEDETFIEYATQLDDGEAACGAIGLTRNYRVATDDRKARTVFSQSQPPIRLLRTSDLVHAWSRFSPCTPTLLQASLREIEARARFRPPNDDPLYGWWTAAA
jgi:hypothetical protein